MTASDDNIQDFGQMSSAAYGIICRCMSKQHLQTTEKGARTLPRQDVLETAIYAVVTAGLVFVLWLSLERFGRSGLGLNIVAVLVLPAFLTRAFERVLFGLFIPQDRSYRLGFLFSTAILIVQWLILRFIQSAPLGFPWLLLAIFGAFFGGLLATSLNEALWENNSPPSEHVREEVYKRHLEIIGMPKLGQFGKRLFDVFLASAGLVIFSPLWLTCSFLIWIEDPGPLLFIKNSVGKGGVNFHQLKFRTMERAAERFTGPVMSSEADGRVLVVGRVLRKTALDELPQLINILLGEMSFVGPRPQRTVLVRGYLEQMPEYAIRHRVLPGLAGLAQVVGDYYLTPRQKLRFDRLYIQHVGLLFDIKLILLAFLLAFWYRWQKGWNGRLPRWLVRYGSKRSPK